MPCADLSSVGNYQCAVCIIGFMNDKQAITPMPFRYIPNALSWCRVGLAFAFPFTPEDWHIAMVVLAGLTEFFDGFLARAFRKTRSPAKGCDLRYVDGNRQGTYSYEQS